VDYLLGEQEFTADRVPAARQTDPPLSSTVPVQPNPGYRAKVRSPRAARRSDRIAQHRPARRFRRIAHDGPARAAAARQLNDQELELVWLTIRDWRWVRTF
jgi:hypothetical protein